jgi:hypothetical protein
VEPTPRTKRTWIQRLPATLFGLLCVMAALVGACVSFILGAMVGWIIEIDGNDIEAVKFIDTAAVSAKPAGVTFAQRRGRKCQEKDAANPFAAKNRRVQVINAADK